MFRRIDRVRGTSLLPFKPETPLPRLCENQAF